MKLSGRLKLVLLAAALALFFLAVVVVVLPNVLVNRPETRTFLRERAAAAVGGEVDFGPIRLALLPRVCAAVDSPRVSLPNGIRLHSEQAEACLQTWPLLRGRVEIESAGLRSPVVRVPIAPLPKEAAGGPVAPPDPRRALAQAAETLRRLPEGRFEIVRGRVELVPAEGTGFELHDLDLSLARRGDAVEFSLAGRSDAVDRVTAHARLGIAGPSGSAAVRLEGARPGRPYAFFFPGRPFQLLESEGDLAVEVESGGPGRLTARADGRFPQLRAAWKGAASQASIERLRAEAELTDTRMALRIPELTAADPRLSLALAWIVDDARTPRIEISLEGGGDAGAARAAALPFLSDVEEGPLVCDIVRGGDVPHIRVALTGSTAEDLKRLPALQIDGRVEHGQINLPFIRFDASGVSGDFHIRDGVLSADGFRAQREGLAAEDGHLRLGLAPDRQTLELDLAARADLAVLPGLLGRMIDDADFQRELKRVQMLSGRAAGRLRLQGLIPDITVAVDADEIDAQARHAAVPYPIRIRGGRIAYSPAALTLEGVDLTIGRSSVSRQQAVLTLDGPPTIRASSPEAVIDLAEAHAWLETIRPVPGLRRVEGSWRLADWRVEGPLADPSAWSVAAGGGVSGVSVAADPLRTPVQIPAASVAWQGRRLRLGDAAPVWGRSAVADLNLELDWSGTPRLGVQAARATLAVEDVLPLALGALPGLESDLQPFLPLSGTVALQSIRSELRFTPAGPELTGATASIAGTSVSSGRLPRPLVLRSGLLNLAGSRAKVSGLDAGFGRSDARGVAFAAGPGAPLEIRAEAADIDCAEAFAALAGLPAADALRQDIAAVSGTLHVTDLALAAPTSAQPRWTATAEVELRELTLTLTYLDDPVRVELARVHAGEAEPSAPVPGPVFRLEPAQVQAGLTRAQVAGTLTLGERETVLDLDVAATALDWGTITRTADRVAARRAPSKEPSGLRGRVRLRAEEFVYERYRLQPLQVTAELGPETSVLIDRARFCGIDVIGKVETHGSQVGVYLVPVAAGLELDGTLRCATREASIVSGSFTLNGELYGTGGTDALIRALNGWLVFTAERGTIRRSLLFARILALLNLTEIYRGQLPDLNTRGIEFQRSSARAEVKDGKLIVQEWSLTGPTFWMGSRGEIDLMNETIDFTIMVSPFRTVDRIVNSIPGLRWILGGRLIAIPMRASGHIDDPRLTPLSPSAVGTSLLEMMQRTLMLPFHIIQPLVPGWEGQENMTITR